MQRLWYDCLRCYMLFIWKQEFLYLGDHNEAPRELEKWNIFILVHCCGTDACPFLYTKRGINAHIAH